MSLQPKHRPGHEREDLLALLQLCAQRAEERRHPQLLSITLAVRHIDPLAVLQAVQNPRDWHAYFEYPADDTAIAGIDAAAQATFSGADRFAKARDFAREILENAVSVGHTDVPFAGPHFFCGFTFENEVTAEGDATFSPANIFLPRWQVARSDGTYTAVANVMIDAASPLETIADRILSAHQRYQHFEYNAGGEGDGSEKTKPSSPVPLEEIGGDWYAGGVERALKIIASDECKKIVLARTFQTTAKISIHRTLERLRERFPSCHTFSFSNGNAATFIGATPERIATVANRHLHTEALAGTAPRGNHAGDDASLGAGLIDSEKDQREHAAVADEIIARLATLGIDAKKTGPTRLLQLPNVHHLRTPISAALPAGTHLLDIGATLHPTPAVGGVPRDNALAAITRLEPVTRGMYAGVVGWFDGDGDGRLLVGLRSALVGDGATKLFAGAGIVAGSDPEIELRETATKLRAMHEALDE